MVHADETSFDIDTGVAVLTGHARVEYGSALLLGDEIRFNQTTGQVWAKGHFTITSGAQRLLAASGTYNLKTGAFKLTGLRAGEPPVFITAAEAEGTNEGDDLDQRRGHLQRAGKFLPNVVG